MSNDISKLYNEVILTEDYTDFEIQSGSIGRIIDILAKNRFEVEFADEFGATCGVLTLKRDEFDILAPIKN